MALNFVSCSPVASKVPLCPPASIPCATIKSTPEFSIACASSKQVAVTPTCIPRKCAFLITCFGGIPKWNVNNSGLYSHIGSSCFSNSGKNGGEGIEYSIELIIGKLCKISIACL